MSDTVPTGCTCCPACGTVLYSDRPWYDGGKPKHALPKTIGLALYVNGEYFRTVLVDSYQIQEGIYRSVYYVKPGTIPYIAMFRVDCRPTADMVYFKDVEAEFSRYRGDCCDPNIVIHRHPYTKLTRLDRRNPPVKNEGTEP